MLDANKVNKVVSCILAGNTIEETHSITGFSERTIQNYIKALNNPDYPNVFNPDLYDEVREKQIETGKERKKWGGMKGRKNNPIDFDKDLALVNLILANNLSIEKAATQIGIDSELLYNVLNNIKNTEVKEKVNSLLKYYKKGKLAKLPSNTQIEIILMMLTFRVSYKTVISKDMFDTTLKDLLEMIQVHNQYHSSLYHLDKETKNEDEINERVAYVKAKNYWNQRNNLVKKLREVTKEEKVNIRNKLKQLRTQIDDSKINKIKKKPFHHLKEEERILFAKFRLKYGLPKEIASQYLSIQHINLTKCEEELAMKDKIYEEKLTLLNKVGEDHKLMNIEDQAKKIITMPQFNPEYFHVLATTDFAEKETNFSRGGGTR